MTPRSTLLTLVLATSLAHAEPKVALDRFDPAPAGDALVTIPDAGVFGRVKPSFGLRLAYARKPLVLSLNRSDGSSESLTLVDHELVAHALASIALGQRLLFDLDAPFVLSQGGEGARVNGTDFASTSGADFGDLRLGTRLALLEPHGEVPGIAFGASVFLPTSSGRYAGAERTRFSVFAIAGNQAPIFIWRFVAGARERPADAVYAGIFGSEVFAGAGAGIRRGNALVAAEIDAATGVDTSTGWFGRNTTQVEALLSGHYAFGPFSAFLAAGPGLTRGAGTPAYRAILGIDGSFELMPATSETTGAPNGAEPSSSGGMRARQPDRDHDGVVDSIDQCPDVIGDPDAPRPGCPRDADGDGIPDSDDHCPNLRGVPSANPLKHGCPSDRDDDDIPDTEDACPDEKGERSQNPKLNGCPPSVVLTPGSIVIKDQVNFATGSDVLAPESSKVLGEVADVMKQHPEIARVAVDGHTDNVGTDKANLALSRRRALAVVRWLIANGIDERRLEARGFGARQPIADTTTDAGRAKNRRVEFQILRRTPLGERGWKDGPADE